MYLSRGLGSATPGADSLITSLAPSYGVPPALALAVAQHESGLDANAVGSAGEIGLFQVKPSTAAQFGVSASGLYDPNQNAVAGLSYLSQMFKRFGNWADALVAYNAGPTSFASGTAPASSRVYSSSILAASGIDNAPSSDLADASVSLDTGSDSSGSAGVSPLVWGAITVGLLGVLVWANA